MNKIVRWIGMIGIIILAYLTLYHDSYPSLLCGIGVWLIMAINGKMGKKK